MWLVLSLVAFLVLVVWLALLKFWATTAPALATAGAHVMITGGSSGIGLALGIRLARHGAHVTIVARDPKKLKEAHAQIAAAAPSKDQIIQQFSADVGDWALAEKVVAEAVKAHRGRLDVLVNNAGISIPERFLETDINNFERLMNVNYFGCLYMTRAAVPLMAKHGGGRVIFVTSVLGLLGFPGYSGYAASKFAVHGLAQSLSTEVHHLNVHISLCTPGNVDTPMLREEDKIKPPETRAIEGTKGVIPPDQVARVIEDSLAHWRFIIPTDGMFGDTWLAGVLNGGVNVASFSELVWQSLLGGLLRPIALRETEAYKGTIRKHVKA